MLRRFTLLYFHEENFEPLKIYDFLCGNVGRKIKIGFWARTSGTTNHIQNPGDGKFIRGAYQGGPGQFQGRQNNFFNCELELVSGDLTKDHI